MDAASLLAQLEPLTHSERMRRMVEIGLRIARGDDAAGLGALVDALQQLENPYARLLALQTCFGSRDGARVLRAMEDRSRMVRGRASRLVPLACDDAQAARALELAEGPRVRTRLAAALRKRKRTQVVDAFIAARLDGAARRGLAEGRAVDLLPFGSFVAVERHAAAFREASSPITWTRLAAHHPNATAAELLRALEGHGPIDPRLRWHLSFVLGPLARRAPDAAVALVRRLFERGVEPGDGLIRAVVHPLCRRAPREIFDVLRARHESAAPAAPPGAFGVAWFDRGAHRLGVERIAWLVRNAWSRLPDGDKGRRWLLRLSFEDRLALLYVWLREGRGSWGAFLFRHVPMSGELAAMREAAFERWSRAAQNKEGVIGISLLEWLPADLRIREARRHFHDVPALATRPRERTAYAALLPYDEAREALKPWLGHPEGEERAAALRTLIASVRFDRTRLADALALVHQKRFEQDPVRGAMLAALLALPRSIYRYEHLEGVGAVVQDALDAADLSGGTAYAAEQLVVRLFRVDAMWGARWLTRLLEARGSVSGLGLGDDLTAYEVLTLAPVLSELAEAWRTRERAGALIWLATSLDRRLPLIPALVAALEQVATELPFVHVAAAALRLLHAHARPHFDALAPRLLAADPSYVLIDVIARFVSLKRQDLLDPFLGDQPMTGRFATGRTHWLIDFEAGHGRWTARQHAVHAAAIANALADRKSDVPSARASLASLARLAFAAPDALIRFASDPRPPIREMAVRALPWLDGGEGVPVLVECLGDDRARYAIYALRTCFREMDPPRVRSVLRAAPFTKVTVAKEVVRLLGEMPGDDAFAELAALDRPGLHRDVRVALLRALWDHLERDEAWIVFERAAEDPDWIVAQQLADIPVARLSAGAETRLCRLLSRVLARPEVEARIALLGRVAGAPLRDAERVLFNECLARMGSPHPDECRTATDAALVRMLPGEAEVFLARVRELAPRRRTLLVILDRVGARLGPYAPGHVTKIGSGLLAILAADRLAVPHYIAFAGRIHGWKEFGELLVSLAERDVLHADAMAAAIGAVRACVHPSMLEAMLAAHRDSRLRRLAVEALQSTAGPEKGWTRERRARLEMYRGDPSPLVAGAAAFVFPPE